MATSVKWGAGERSDFGGARTLPAARCWGLPPLKGREPLEHCGNPRSKESFPLTSCQWSSRQPRSRQKHEKLGHPPPPTKLPIHQLAPRLSLAGNWPFLPARHLSSSDPTLHRVQPSSRLRIPITPAQPSLPAVHLSTQLPAKLRRDKAPGCSTFHSPSPKAYPSLVHHCPPAVNRPTP
jgi:hypothetical protein